MSTHPRHLGKYELQEQLGPVGTGGMEEVWKTLDTQLQRHVVVKLLHVNLKEDPHFIARFEREAQLMASLHHPNIVPIHDFQTVSSEKEGTIAYMVMDYIEGPTLADYIRSTSGQRNFPSATELVPLFTSIGLAVDYAHQNGMIHRDLKPANILLDQHNTTRNPIGEPILTDFGLARFLGTSATALTATQLGTPLYVAPEQVSGSPGNERSDIYSLGIILYEMVTGRPPFQGDSPTDVMSQHLTAIPRSPMLINPHIPPELEMVITRCLAKDPAARFPSASSLASAIAAALPTNAEPMPTFTTNTSSEVMPFAPSVPTVRTSTPPPASISQQFPSSPPARGGRQSAPMTPIVPMAPMSASSSAAQATPVFGEPTQWTNTAPPAGPSGVSTPTLSPPNIIPSPPLRPRRKPRRGLILVGSIALLLVVVLGAVLGVLYLWPRTVNPLVGHAFYVSSGQLADGAQGIADQLKVDLQNIQSPPSGKSYYLWLLADKDTTPKPDLLVPSPLHPPLLLMNNLPVSNGAIHYIYPGDAQHDNLLAVTSRLLITLEDAGKTPANPSTDRSTWVYYAELPQEYIPTGPAGLVLRGLDHIRHIYYNEDHAKVLALYGGLDIWVFRNTVKLLELSTSARDSTNMTQMHNLFTGMLAYLDGIPNVQIDLPPGTPIENADTTVAQISLLNVDPTRQGKPQYLQTDPPGDLAHLLLHLTELNRAPDATPQIHALSQEILKAINNAQALLNCARADAKDLFYMTLSPSVTPTPNTTICEGQAAQGRASCLQRPAQDVMTCLLDDMVTQVTYAYLGQLDPATNTVIPGVLQAHRAAQQLATFDVTTNLPQSL